MTDKLSKLPFQFLKNDVLFHGNKMKFSYLIFLLLFLRRVISFLRRTSVKASPNV